MERGRICANICLFALSRLLEVRRRWGQPALRSADECPRESLPPSRRRKVRYASLAGMPTSARSLAPPFPQKGTLASSARLQVRSRRLRCATTFSRWARLAPRNISQTALTSKADVPKLFVCFFSIASLLQNAKSRHCVSVAFCTPAAAGVRLFPTKLALCGDPVCV